MKTFMKTLLGAAGALALAAPASAQADNPYDLSGMDLNMEACTLEMGLSDMLSSATVDNLGDALSAYTDGRAALVSEFNGSPAGLALANAAATAKAQRAKQIVYLEFNDANPTFNVFSGGVPFAGGVFPDYIYTDEDKQTVRTKMKTAFARYNISFVLTEPAQGDFSTIQIGFNDQNPIDLQGGILFGRADNIDFGNDVRNDNAFADASFWQLLAELDANFGTQNLANFLGLPGPLSPEGVEAVRQIAVVNQSANTASHELGHILGLRHHDSFGAPGQGLPPARLPEEFIPVLETDQNALETIDHVMASGASAGLPLANPVLFDRFFSERSSAKLWINRFRKEIEEASVGPNFPFVKLVRRKIPNLLQTGQNAGGRLFLNQSVVNGSISELGQEDRYVHFLKAGQVFNAEIISSSDVTIEDDMWGKLTLGRIQSIPGTDPEIVAENQTTFEGREPLLFDFTIPETGFYVLTVSAPDSVPLGGGFVNLSDFLFDPETGATFYDIFGLGDYQVYSNIIEAKPPRGVRPVEVASLPQ